ncbi:MAG: CPBP family intramembrane glutamic endopeptidase [Pseudomonadota bacterium]
MIKQDPKQAGQVRSEPSNGFSTAVLGTLALGVVGAVLALVFDVALPVQPTASALLLGVAATLPMALFFVLFVGTKHPRVSAFREDQLKFFAGMPYLFTPSRVVILALLAGINEELLFRGFLQPYADRFMPTTVAIVVTNVLFGLLHARTFLYMIITTLIGIYLGFVLVWTDSLIAPMTAHALYDIIALEWTRRLLKSRGFLN